jgi:very-short-patch-repair endonuclease
MTHDRHSHRDNVLIARELRGRQTAAERLLWSALRNRKPNGLKFRRQHPIGPFVADFCCPDRTSVDQLRRKDAAHWRVVITS